MRVSVSQRFLSISETRNSPRCLDMPCTYSGQNIQNTLCDLEVYAVRPTGERVATKASTFMEIVEYGIDFFL